MVARLLLPLLLLLACGHVATAARPSNWKSGDGGYSTGGDAGQQCTTPGGCEDEDEEDEPSSLRDELRAQLHASRGGKGGGAEDKGGMSEVERLQAKLDAMLGAKPNVKGGGAHEENDNDDEYDSDDDDDSGDDEDDADPTDNSNEGYDIEGVDPTYLQHLNTLEPYALHEMHDALSEIVGNAGITTAMQRHVERTLISHRYPNGNPGVEGPTYANVGSLLDISTVYSASWGGSTEFGGKPSWIASIFYRQGLVERERGTPCLVDLADDYDAEEDDPNCCHLGVTIDDYVSVRGIEEKTREHMELAAYWDILDEGKWRTGTVLELDFGGQKFDTILANGILTGEDETVVSIMEKLKSLLKPGGVVFFVGTEPQTKVDGPGGLYADMLDVIDSVKQLAGEVPTRNLPATWINANLDRLGLDVFSSTRFALKSSFDDIRETVQEGTGWIDEAESPALTFAIKNRYTKKLNQMLDQIAGVARSGPISAGEYQYIIAAELPKDGKKEATTLVEPTIYKPKPKRSRIE